MEDNKKPEEIKKVGKAEVDKILTLLSQVQIAVNQIIPKSWPERRIVDEKLTEATIWLKIGHDMAANPIQGFMITPKKAEIV